MTSAKDIIDDILRREGSEFTARPSDKGGATKFGITARTLGSFWKFDRQATVEEVKNLTEEEARSIYYDAYVLPWQFVAGNLRMLLIDWGVTTSHGRVIRSLQAVLTELSFYRGAIDGIAGPDTQNALMEAQRNAMMEQRVYTGVLEARIRFYVKLGLDEPARKFLKDTPTTQLHNLSGWVNRCMEFL